MQKSIRRKSTARKPLIDISNGKKCSRVSTKKNNSKNDISGSALDQLLLVQSDFSNLFVQIDELVAEAMQSDITDRKATQDVESFRKVLSNMHLTLKPWISRLRQSLTTTSTAVEKQLDQTLVNQSTSTITKNKEVNIISNRSETELDLIVSPSPLVSWNAGSFADAYTLEAGKQLFLLTPLPKSKIAPSKCPGTSKTILRIPNNSKNQQKVEKMPCVVEAKEYSLPILTPCLKKTTEDILEPPTQLNNLNNSEEGLGSDDMLKDLTSRYQELLCIQPDDNNKYTNRRKDNNQTLDWFLSPPKTCKLMEPNDEKAVPTPANFGPLLMATPLFEDVESTVIKGKRAGENTLKKELWTRFEEASRDGWHLDKSVIQKAARKGFMDMLEEACESECGDGKWK